MQLDFLATIPEPTPPMKPIDPSPDGTPPLPLLNEQPSIPPRPIFHFDSDPFFNPRNPAQPATPVAMPGTIPAEPDGPAEAEPPPDVDVAADELPAPPDFAPATAEERLLHSIVQAPEANPAAVVPLISAAELTSLREQLDSAIEQARKAEITRQKAQQDLAAMKTRLAGVETELSATRLEVDQSNQARHQTETRFAEAEKQWTEKLSVLRRMLDEVEDTRDEVYQKRVPKLLFAGTLIAGIVATLFAYLIGAGQAGSPSVNAHVPPPPMTAPPEVPPITPPVIPEAPPPMTPPVAPLLVPEAPAITPPPAPIIQEKPAPSLPVSPPSRKPAQPASGKKADWPPLTGGRWSTTSTAREMKVVFHYGIFVQNTRFSSEAKGDLKTIASALKGHPFQIEVEGHTDATKIKQAKSSGSSNKALGMARAKAVADYLTGPGGLPSTMITTSSSGEGNPPYPNTTAANQQKNRTVVLKITAR